jgi:diguanylate cyclase (GGDEF)-like protein
MSQPKSSLPNSFPLRDELTAALSRRAFLEEAVSEFRKFQRYGHPFALMIFDVDAFGEFNQRHGAESGDKALKQIVAAAAQTLREHDLIGRLGGDEFGVLLLETSAEGAVKTAERLRLNCAALSYEVAEEPKSLTITLGVSGARPDDRSLEQVFSRADAALAEARKEGGNRVVLG